MLINKKNAIIINGKKYIPVITKGIQNPNNDCECCDMKILCEKNEDIYCYLTVFKTVFRESKLHRHFELIKENKKPI